MVVKSAFESFGCFFKGCLSHLFLCISDRSPSVVFYRQSSKDGLMYPKMQLHYSICIYLQHIYL